MNLYVNGQTISERVLINYCNLQNTKCYLHVFFSQVGFAKRETPKFNGAVLDFPLLKKKLGRGNCLPQLIELNSLKGNISDSSKNKLYEFDKLKLGKYYLGYMVNIFIFTINSNKNFEV